MVAQRLESFGRIFTPTARWIGAEEAMRRLKSGDVAAGSLLAYGNGRSYGDSCLNPDGELVDMRSMRGILSFDAHTGLVEAEAGTLLSDIIAHAAPYGFFPQVVPGTQYVTLGGAIANDVHGKNHHRRGTFGRHVESLTLLRSDGRIHRCSATTNPPLFAATIGGMGLTGLILTATIRLMRVPSLDILETVTPFRDLDEFFDLVEEADLVNEYAVAWIDQQARGRSAGRGLLMAGNHAEHGSVSATPLRRSISIPFQPPFTLLGRPVLKVFNRAYRLARGVSRRPHRTPCQRFFFPLDGVCGWNQLYGPRGLFQHQSVVPGESARRVVPQLLETARQAGHGSFLTVLKRFGHARSPGLLSFPRAGYTLTLDFPNRGEPTLALLKQLDRLTTDAGGAVNPYKDARMGADTFSASFPDWQSLERIRDPAFISGFWMRATGASASRRDLMSAAE